MIIRNSRFSIIKIHNKFHTVTEKAYQPYGTYMTYKLYMKEAFHNEYLTSR